MPDLPKVSVIVPVYNSEATLGECLRSLLNVNYPKTDLEFIFVNNASTDGTQAILTEFSDQIRILYEAKKGAAAARNQGILNARGDLIAFTDADCIVDKDWLRNIISPLQDPLVGIVGGTILTKRPFNKIEKFGESIHDHNAAINLYKPPHVMTVNWSSRLSVLKEQNLFDERFIRSQDVDLSYRILQSGYKFVFQPDAIIYHKNKTTFKGLFDEGFTHGFYSIQVVRKHKIFLKNLGKERFGARGYLALVSSFVDYLLGKNRDHSMCYCVFNVGKKIGKIFGSVRFFYLDL